jgi:hypothetical protein
MPKLKRYTNWLRNEFEPIDEPSSQKKDVVSVGKDIMAYPQVRVNWTMEVNKPDPDILEVLLPKSQKLVKDVLTASNGRSKCTKYQMLSDKEKKKKTRRINRKQAKHDNWI